MHPQSRRLAIGPAAALALFLIALLPACGGGGGGPDSHAADGHGHDHDGHSHADGDGGGHDDDVAHVGDGGDDHGGSDGDAGHDHDADTHDHGDFPEDSPEDAAIRAAHDPNAKLAEIVCTADVHDFGRVWEGSEVAHEFILTAGGEAPLILVSVRPDCGCTLAHIEVLNDDGTRTEYEMETPVEPGTKLALAATYDSKGRDGHQSRTIKVYGNIAHGVREMKLQADVRPFLKVEPRIQSLGKLSQLESATTDYVVKSVGGERFSLKPTRKGLPDELTVAVEPVDPDDDGRATSWKIVANLGIGMPKGIRSYTLDLETDLVNRQAAPRPDGKESHFVISPMVNAMIVGPVAALPQNINFGMVSAGQTVAKTVTLESHDPGFSMPEPTVEVKAYREGASLAFADTLRITKRPSEEKNGWEIELLLEGLGEEVGRSFLGKLVIDTGHPDEPQLEVTLSGLKRGS
ncbi:MAG: DUF1573 domain-containing protein [Planctomycetota bacterium]